MSDQETVIKHETCLKCGRCVNICPMKRMDLVGGKIVVTDDPRRSCRHCGHCMAVCPTQSIFVEGYDYSDFEDLPPELPGYGDIEPLLKARRSVRHYQNKPVDREILEKVVEGAATAPYGMPPTNVEVIVVGSRDKVEEVVSLVHEEFKKWQYMMNSPMITGLLKLTGKGKMVSNMQTKVLPLVNGILRAAEKGRDYLTYDAPAMILFHAEKGSVSYRENCLIALSLAMISAQSLGLGTCIIGFIPPSVERSGSIKGMLGIPDGNEVVGALVLGWSRVTYNRSIPRRFRSLNYV